MFSTLPLLCAPLIHRANDSETVSERFRVALDATSVRVSRVGSDSDGGTAGDGARSAVRYNLWAALLQVHLPMIIQVWTSLSS